MPAYAVALMRSVNWNASIIEYIRKITRTLEPHSGRFLVHGDNPVVMDGEFTGHLVMIEFPTRKNARDWYFCKEYQEILAMRRYNSDSAVLLVDGVAPGYSASDLLKRY